MIAKARLPRSRIQHAHAVFEQWAILLLGTGLRLFYAFSTPFAVRAHDLQGHTQYITYVLAHWKTPHAWQGWEMNQPPLYYFAAALCTKFRLLFGPLKRKEMWSCAADFSLVFSIATLGMGLAIARVLFPQGTQRAQAALFLGIIATFPGIVFFSANVSNDALVTFLLFGFTWALLSWWESGKTCLWFLCAAFVTLGILAKFTALPAALVLFLCLACKPGISHSVKCKLAAAAIAIITIGAGWILAMRFYDGHLQQLALPGALGLHTRLRLPFNALDLLSFNPVRILATTYNDPWTDAFGRQYFWEYFFKSAFFGEWKFAQSLRWLHRAVLAGGFFTLVLGAIGVASDIRKKGTFRVPLLLLLGTGLLSAFFFRLLHSAASEQDFRFVPQIIIPFAAYACIGLNAFPPRWKLIPMAVLAAYCTLCGAFLFSVAAA